MEQEVKRRLLEERVQREKQRRIEREKERLEREQELNKIRKAHEKELQRLKDRYESTQCVHVNVPTKANPYANTMVGQHVMILHLLMIWCLFTPEHLHIIDKFDKISLGLAENGFIVCCNSLWPSDAIW